MRNSLNLQEKMKHMMNLWTFFFFFLQFLPLHTVQLSWICLPQLFCHELSELFCYQTQIKLKL